MGLRRLRGPDRGADPRDDAGLGPVAGRRRSRRCGPPRRGAPAGGRAHGRGAGPVRPLLVEGDVAVVAHGYLARLLTVRWLGLDASAGRLLGHPHPGTLSLLATEDGQPVISAWNVA
ncbi:histidine phosphatase family protein [Streptomyces sp. 5.8]|uniref:histidine phosphatase family protein n=1 Tax=Streptomyces sp. 5.8 TaxID=3406571 RepID=UPI003BB6F7F5